MLIDEYEKGDLSDSYAGVFHISRITIFLIFNEPGDSQMSMKRSSFQVVRRVFHISRHLLKKHDTQGNHMHGMTTTASSTNNLKK